MKRIAILFLLVCLGATLSISAQSAADKIVGVYRVVKDGRNSKVKVFKHGGGYRAQVIWLENMKNPDGSQRTDAKNPDPAKRNTPSNQRMTPTTTSGKTAASTTPRRARRIKWKCISKSPMSSP